MQHQNMQKFKICKKKFMKSFARFILFWKPQAKTHYFKLNLYFYIIHANMQNWALVITIFTYCKV